MVVLPLHARGRSLLLLLSLLFVVVAVVVVAAVVVVGCHPEPPHMIWTLLVFWAVLGYRVPQTYGRMVAPLQPTAHSSTLDSWCTFERGGVLHGWRASVAQLLVSLCVHIPDFVGVPLCGVAIRANHGHNRSGICLC